MNQTSLPPDILRRARLDFPEGQAFAVLRLLEGYTGNEPDRVRRCILHLASGASDKVDHFTKLAAIDYRDIILFAEYDHENRRVRDLSKPFK